MFGELAWAASPISWTRPVDQVGGDLLDGENQTSAAGGTSASRVGTGSGNAANSAARRAMSPPVGSVASLDRTSA